MERESQPSRLSRSSVLVMTTSACAASRGIGLAGLLAYPTVGIPAALPALGRALGRAIALAELA